MNKPTKHSNEERIRIHHALERIEACVASMRIALRDETTPIGHDAVQAMTQTAIEVAVHAASADAALRLSAEWLDVSKQIQPSSPPST